MQPVSCASCQALQRRLRELQAENERLRRQLDEATRARKRQAAPFAKGQPKPNPRKPGRKPGKDYGPKAYRRPLSPEQIDERRSTAYVALAAVAVFPTLVAVLHAIEPEFDPSWRMLSEYAIGHHGWVMALAFLSLGIGS